MILTLELPPDLERLLREEAARQGLTLPEYALRVLAASIESGKQLVTGSDLVDFWQQEQLLGSRQDIEDTEAFAQTLRRQAESRAQ